MALINCRECNHLYSSHRKQCPKCSAYTNPANGELTAGEKRFKEALEKQGMKGYSVEEIKKSNKQTSIMLVAILALVVVGLVKCVSSITAPRTSDEFKEFDSYQARLYCKWELEKLLRDPSSLRIEDVTIVESDGHLGIARIKYQAKNGFGGVNRRFATCRKYEDSAGTVRLKVDL